MTTTLRNGIVTQEPQIELSETVECDEMYVVAGHKGHSESVKKKDERPENADRKDRVVAARRRRTSLRFWE